MIRLSRIIALAGHPAFTGNWRCQRPKFNTRYSGIKDFLSNICGWFQLSPCQLMMDHNTMHSMHPALVKPTNENTVLPCAMPGLFLIHIATLIRQDHPDYRNRRPDRRQRRNPGHQPQSTPGKRKERLERPYEFSRGILLRQPIPLPETRAPDAKMPLLKTNLTPKPLRLTCVRLTVSRRNSSRYKYRSAFRICDIKPFIDVIIRISHFHNEALIIADGNNLPFMQGNGQIIGKVIITMN